MEFKDYYKALEIERTASQDEVRKAYRKLARKYHPDVSKEADAQARMRDINEANDVLRDKDKRAWPIAWHVAEHRVLLAKEASSHRRAGTKGLSSTAALGRVRLTMPTSVSSFRLCSARPSNAPLPVATTGRGAKTITQPSKFLWKMPSTVFSARSRCVLWRRTPRVNPLLSIAR